MRTLLVSLAPVVAVAYFILYPNDLFNAIGWVSGFLH